ncbi:MAG: hypothetical protein INR62_10360, partial [Rhodospirillales bacterium]|nr:hypothetical protein [Acetobacter sp.]
MIRAFIILALLMVPGLRASLAADAPASPPPKTITQDQARLALDVLNDPAKRTAFAATLNAILANQPGSQKAPNAETPSKPATTSIEGVHVPLAPDSLGAQVLLSASDLVTRLGNQTVDAIDAVQSLPLLYGWIIVMATNPVAQSLLLDVTWRVAIILAAAAGAWWLLHKLLRRPIARLQRFGRLTDLGSRSASVVSLSETSSAKSRHRLSPWTLLTRVPVVFARMLLELVPVLGILLVGHIAAASSLGGQTISRLIILAVIDAAAVCAAVLSVARMLLSPGQPQLRLFHIQDATAGYLMRWLKRLTLIVVVGYLAGEVGLSLALSSIAHNAIQKTVGLVVHVCLIIIVLRQRHAVQQWLHAPADAKDLTARVRNALALIWHWVAIFFLVAGWIVWAVELPHGYTIMLHYFIITALMLIGTRLTLLLWLGGLDRAFKAQMKPEYAGIRARFRTYYPLLSGAI